MRSQVSTTPQYEKVAFTNHARERMAQRIISEEMVMWAIRHPDKTYLEEDGDTKFICNVSDTLLHVVCKPLPEEGKWLVKSTYVRGEDDYGNKVTYKGPRRQYAQRTYQRPYRRPTQRSASPSSSLVVNILLFAVLLGGLALLAYLLLR